MEHITHPLIKEKKIERRNYQIAIAATALMKNTLVIIPTGLGKTVVALLVIASRLLNKDGKALILAPTKPLVEQHASFFRENLKLNPEEIVALSGEIKPEKREELWGKAKLIISTPQVIENDLIAGRISLKDVIHLTFDEAHRAVGNYPYVFIAKEYLKQSKNPLILAITASPGSDIERIREVIENLTIEEIEIRTEYSKDVKPYIHEKKMEWVKVEMPKELKETKEAFEKALELRFKKLEKLGFS
ncbi:Hef nuclease, partial [Archaeoglobales archaeon]